MTAICPPLGTNCASRAVIPRPVLISGAYIDSPDVIVLARGRIGLSIWPRLLTQARAFQSKLTSIGNVSAVSINLFISIITTTFPFHSRQSTENARCFSKGPCGLMSTGDLSRGWKIWSKHLFPWDRVGGKVGMFLGVFWRGHVNSAVFWSGKRWPKNICG